MKQKIYGLMANINIQQKTQRNRILFINKLFWDGEVLARIFKQLIQFLPILLPLLNISFLFYHHCLNNILTSFSDPISQEQIIFWPLHYQRIVKTNIKLQYCNRFSDYMSHSNTRIYSSVLTFFAINALLFLILCQQTSLNILTSKQSFQEDYSHEEPFLQQGEQLSSEGIGFINEEYYVGTYQKVGQNKLFNYLDSETGNIQIVLYKSAFSSRPEEIDSAAILLFDPVYHDQKASRIEIELGKMTNKYQWNSSHAIIKEENFWKFRKQQDRDNDNITDVTYKILLSNIQNRNPKEVQIYIEFEGPQFQFTANFSYDEARLSTFLYCLYVSFVVSIQIVSAYFLLKKIDTVNPNIVNKISLTTMVITNIEDFYLTMANIEYIMTSRSSTYLFYILPSICYITLFVIMDMKLLFLAWRSHYMAEIDNPQTLRKKLTTFYIKFYLGLFVYLTLTYFFSYDGWMILLQNLFMIPQIVHNAKIGRNPGFEPLYILGYLGSRFLKPLYERACPNNHLMLVPMVGIVITLFLLYILQISILFLQNLFGPRFFIPRALLPNHYNYQHKLKISQQNKDLQCNICLQGFFTDSLNLNSSELEDNFVKQKIVMKTPCNHYFHQQCIVNWTDVKLECPTCRSPLPPI